MPTSSVKEPKVAFGSLDCQVAGSFELLGTRRDEWDQAVLALGGPIYMSYDWTRVWWTFYGQKRRLKIFVFRADGRIVGILPIFIETIGSPFLNLRVARLAGSAIPPKVFDPPVAAEWGRQVWARVYDELFAQERCDLLSLGPVSTEYKSAAAMREACDDSPNVGGFESAQSDVRTVYQLPVTYEEYFGSLESKERKVRRKKLRDLEAAWPIRTEVVEESTEVGKEFEAFVDQHSRQWNAEGRPGHFVAWPNALEYNRALVQALAPLGRVRFYKVVAGDQVLTNQYTYVFGDALFAELPARIAGPEWERFSLGCTSQVKLIESAIHQGIKRLESGLGHYEYKILTGGKESPVNMIRVVRRSLCASLKVGVSKLLSQLFRLAVHKIWYRRIMPRLSGASRAGQPKWLLHWDF